MTFFVLLVSYVLACLLVNKLLNKAHIDQITEILVFASAHHKVVRFDVPMQVVVIVQRLNSIQHLQCEHTDRLNRKFFVFLLEQRLKGFAEQRHDHHSALTSFFSKVMDVHDTLYRQSVMWRHNLLVPLSI